MDSKGTLYDLNGRPINNADRFRGPLVYGTASGQAYIMHPNGTTTSISTQDYERALSARYAFPAIIGRT